MTRDDSATKMNNVTSVGEDGIKAGKELHESSEPE